MLLLNANEVESILDLDRLIEALAPAMADLSTGKVAMPQRNIAIAQDQGGLLANMPVYIPSSKTLATKSVSLYPNNASLGLETHHALITVFDSTTGVPLALMDGKHITAARTSAGSALATNLLARLDANVLVIVGTGVQALAHARAIPKVRPIKEVRVVGRNQERADQLANKIAEELGIEANAAASLREAASGADIICAATHSTEPVVQGSYLETGVHVNSVGLNPSGRELDDEAVAKSLVVVEYRQAALAEGPGGANDLIWPIRDGVIKEDHIHAEIGELIAGTKEGRTSPEQITLYKSVGVAVQDAIAAQIVLDTALAQGVGTAYEI